MKKILKILRLSTDPKLRYYIGKFVNEKNEEIATYYKHLYKLRYDEIIKKRGWLFNLFFLL